MCMCVRASIVRACVRVLSSASATTLFLFTLIVFVLETRPSVTLLCPKEQTQTTKVLGTVFIVYSKKWILGIPKEFCV